MANITGHNAVIVKAPIEEVFEKFNDPNLQSEWYQQMFNLSDYTPPFQKGTTYTVKGKFMGRPTEFKYEVVNVDPLKQVVLKLSGSGTGMIAHNFEKAKDGIKVEIEFSRDMTAWMSSNTALEIHNVLYSRITADLQGFKKFVEA